MKNILEAQLRSKGISDSDVLRVMSEVPREKFVPEDQKSQSYADSALSIGFEQTISQPFIVAHMTSALLGGSRESVLEIGTGSGYQTAILAKLFKKVYTIEVIDALSLRARAALTGLGFENIEYRVGDGYEGWSEKAPFDAIMITAAIPKIPAPLLDQLGISGRMIVPVGISTQRLIKVSRGSSGQLIQEQGISVRFVPFVRK